MSDKIVLNGGGTRFETSYGTLRNVGSYFINLCGPDNQYQIPADGVYFIDRDPEQFRHLLNFARNGMLPSKFHWSSLEAEAQFFGYDSLIQALESYQGHDDDLHWMNVNLRTIADRLEDLCDHIKSNRIEEFHQFLVSRCRFTRCGEMFRNHS